MENIRATWAQNLQAARRQRQLTQERLAREIEVASIQVSRWERGVTVPKDATKRRLAEFYGVPLAELFPWDEAVVA